MSASELLSLATDLVSGKLQTLHKDAENLLVPFLSSYPPELLWEDSNKAQGTVDSVITHTPPFPLGAMGYEGARV